MRMVSCTNSYQIIHFNSVLSCGKEEFYRIHIYLTAQLKLDSLKSYSFKMYFLLLNFISLDGFDMQLFCKVQPHFFSFGFLLVYLDYLTQRRSKILMQKYILTSKSEGIISQNIHINF